MHLAALTSDPFVRYLGRSFLIVVLIFATISAFNFIVDPFQRNGVFQLGFNKDDVARTMNERLYKMLEFQNSPTPNIIVGDSRSGVLEATVLKNLGYSDWYNLSYDGGSLDEALDTIAFAADHLELRKVILGVTFESLNGNARENIFQDSEGLFQKWYMYYTSYSVLRASFATVYLKISGQSSRPTVPPLEPEAWWRHLLDQARENLRTRREPQALKERLDHTIRELRGAGVDVVIFIPPAHAELRAIYDLENPTARRTFKNYVYSLAPTIDFDIDSSLTRNRSNFTDPVHISLDVLDEVIMDLLGGGSLISVKKDQAFESTDG